MDNTKLSIISLPISDSFVHPNVKLEECNGNGESRLFISNNKRIFNKIVEKKKAILLYDKNYLDKERIENINFKKKNIDRITNIKSNIKEINKSTINIIEQNGKKDVNRKYIGQNPHRKKKK